VCRSRQALLQVSVLHQLFQPLAIAVVAGVQAILWIQAGLACKGIVFTL